MNRYDEEKICKYCQDIKDFVDVKGFIIGLDNNHLLFSYCNDKKQVSSSWSKKINYCPMCGRKLNGEVKE